MKITFDIPDGSVAAFLNFIYQDGRTMAMGCRSVETTELVEGAVLLFEPEGGEGNG